VVYGGAGQEQCDGEPPRSLPSLSFGADWCRRARRAFVDAVRPASVGTVGPGRPSRRSRPLAVGSAAPAASGAGRLRTVVDAEAQTVHHADHTFEAPGGVYDLRYPGTQFHPALESDDTVANGDEDRVGRKLLRSSDDL